ncbi:hypothetical protein [Caudoviricetes sp.]|nr:hypothetical protein [Caudoviricetes sp.]
MQIVTASIVNRFEVRITDIQAAEKAGYKYFVAGNQGLFSKTKPRGKGWVQIATPAQINEPEAA